MGPLRDLSLRLEPGNDRNIAHDCRNRHSRRFRWIDWQDGETFWRKTDALHRPVFWIGRNACGRVGQNRRVVTGFDPDHFTLEHFHASCAKHDDSSRQRAGARRITRSAPEHAFDHIHYWPMVIPSNFWMVHRSKASLSPSRRTVLSGSRFSFYRDADVDTHQANTAAIRSGH